MKTALFLAAFLFSFITNGQTISKAYNEGKPVQMDTFTKVSDSLKTANSEWHIATIEELKQLQVEIGNKRENKQLVFSGNYWSMAKTSEYEGSVLCFVAPGIFKTFLPTEQSSGGIQFVKK